MTYVSSESPTTTDFLDCLCADVFKKTQSEVSGISDEALTIFTWLAFGVLCPLISTFGIGTNIINIICFLKHDLKDAINVSLLGLAVSDLISLITLLGLNCIYNPSLLQSDLPLDAMEVGYLIFTTPHTYFTRVSSWITAVITLERCMCIISPLKVKSCVSPKRMILVIAIIYLILVFSTVPMYAVNRLGMTFSPLRNKTILGRVAVGDHESIESLSYIINNFTLSMSAFVVIVICTVILVVKLQKTTKWRQQTTAPAQADRVSKRNQRVATMVVMISTLFIICFAPVCITALAVAIEPEISLGGRYLKVGMILGGLGLVLESINSSMNIFAYYHMSSKYKETFIVLFVRKKNYLKSFHTKY